LIFLNSKRTFEQSAMFTRSTSQLRLRQGLAAQAGVYAAAHLESMNPSAIVPTLKPEWFGTKDSEGRLMR
jgi:hypothetical protein